MPDDHELHSPAVQSTLDEAVETLSGFITEHEHTDHSGAPCQDERLNMVAWVAHRIGWAPRKGIFGAQDLAELEARIDAYKKHHDEDHHG